MEELLTWNTNIFLSTVIHWIVNTAWCFLLYILFVVVAVVRCPKIKTYVLIIPALMFHSCFMGRKVRWLLFAWSGFRSYQQDRHLNFWHRCSTRTPTRSDNRSKCKNRRIGEIRQSMNKYTRYNNESSFSQVYHQKKISHV